MLRDFTDLDILQKFQESLAKSFRDQDDERDQYFGMWASRILGMKDEFWHRAQAILTYLHLGLSLRELIHEFKYQTLVLFKCCLLQPKVFSSLQLQLYPLTWPDVVLRVTLRASLHDAILTNLINTWTNSSPARLR